MIKLLRYLKPFRFQFILALVLIFLQTLTELFLPALMAGVVDRGIIQGDTLYIFHTGGLMLAASLAGILFSAGSGYLSARISMGFGKILRGKLFSHVETFSLREVDQIGTPSLITRATNDVTQLQMTVLFVMRMMISAPMMAIGGIIMALAEDPKLSLVIVGVIPVLAGIIALITFKGMPLFKAVQKKIDRINLILRENLSGIRVVRAFNRTDHEKERFDAANTDLTRTATRVNRLMTSLMPTMMLLMNGTTLLLVWFGALRIQGGSMQVGSLMAFIQYAAMILFSLLMSTMMIVMLPRAQASAERVQEVLSIEPEIGDPALPKTPEGTTGRVEFDHVTFTYHGAEEPALCDISFSANPGEVTAIIGGTGAGKSTLVHLIPRFYDIDIGHIRVDGQDVREYSQEALRARIGFVPQKAVLFSGTIAENLRFGKEEATDEEIEHASKIAQAHSFISEMNEGYSSFIAQGGKNLSGGQKQRLSIARALVRNPGIYIFDDTFSALDFKTDSELRAALRKETSEATVIIVAQRVNTIFDADRIIVLDDGRIAGIGKHRELLASCEVYREIVSSQMGPEGIQ